MAKSNAVSVNQAEVTYFEKFLLSLRSDGDQSNAQPICDVERGRAYEVLSDLGGMLSFDVTDVGRQCGIHGRTFLASRVWSFITDAPNRELFNRPKEEEERIRRLICRATDALKHTCGRGVAFNYLQGKGKGRSCMTIRARFLPLRGEVNVLALSGIDMDDYC